MKLVFVDVMQELHRFDSTSYITQPPVPLDVIEREIDQLGELHPAAFLQFTDDSLLADRAYAIALLRLVRHKQRRFVTSTSLYKETRPRGKVIPEWWLAPTRLSGAPQ